jgi:non-specific protein-tyrosine kinase
MTGAAFVVWQMPLRHLDRVAGVVGVNTPHWDRRRPTRSSCSASGFGDQHVHRPVPEPAREPDKIFGSRVEQTFDAFMRKPVPPRHAGRSSRSPASAPRRGSIWRFRR